MKTLGFLQNPALTPENPKISLHRLIRCHLPTHQLSCNQCMSLPTWHSLCLAQLHPDTPTLSYLWLWKSIYPWIDSVCTDTACCGSSSLNFSWLTQRWTSEKDHSVDITINKQYKNQLCIVCDCTTDKSGAVRIIFFCYPASLETRSTKRVQKLLLKTRILLASHHTEKAVLTLKILIESKTILGSWNFLVLFHTLASFVSLPGHFFLHPGEGNVLVMP